MDNDRPVIGYCIYCKGKIYTGEAFVVSGNNTYHASETNDHDNCYRLVIEGEEEE